MVTKTVRKPSHESVIAAIERAASEEVLRALGDYLCETVVPLEGIPAIQQAFQKRACELFPTRPLEELAFASRVVDGLMAHAREQEEKKGSEEMRGVDVAAKIEWPQTRLLRNEALWNRNVATVKILCELGVVTEWVTGRGAYTHMPYHYIIRGIAVQFLPHWKFLKIGGVDIDTTFDKEDIVRAVEAIKVLNKLGLKPQEN